MHSPIAVSRRAALVAGSVGLVSALGRSGLRRDVAAQEGTPVVRDEASLPPFAADEQLALDAIVEEIIAAEAAPGSVAGLWIAERGAWTHAAGIGNLETAAPITADDHFRIASVTKTFVATVALQLVDEGLLSLDDILESYVPGIPNGAEITMRQVLGMTAGIFNYINDPEFEAAYTNDPLMAFTPQDAVEIIKRHPADFAPGEKVQYSDSNYILAGLIIEKVTGGSAAEAITSRIIEPLGLTGTSFPDSPEMPEPYAQGYAADPGSAALRDLTESNPEVPWTAGAIISTLDDLRVWGRVLAEGTLLSAETQAARLQIGPISSVPGFDVGYGLGIMDVNGFLGHSGAIFGYSTWVVRSPEEQATIVVLANRGETETEFAGTIAADIAHLFFPERFPRAASAPATPTPAP
ncbi:MAG: serine hydrolase domain-containing protein [Thermomicrobiales bacterium]